jgi:hypothetical protein
MNKPDSNQDSFIVLALRGQPLHPAILDAGDKPVAGRATPTHKIAQLNVVRCTLHVFLSCLNTPRVIGPNLFFYLSKPLVPVIE